MWRQKVLFLPKHKKMGNLISQRQFSHVFFLRVYIALFSDNPAPILSQSPTFLNRSIAPGIQPNTIQQELARLVPPCISVLLGMIHAVKTGAN